MRKKGMELTDTVIGLIVAVVIVAVLVVLVARLIDPGYSERDAVAEAYFERLVESVKDGEGEVLMLGRDESFRFYLVYFGGLGSWTTNVDKGEQEFLPKNVGKNVVCVCYDKLDTVYCRYCEDLDFPAVSSSFDGVQIKGSIGPWVIQDGNRVEIKKDGERYVFFK